MKVNGEKDIKMTFQDEFSTIQLLIRMHYKAHDHQGFIHGKYFKKLKEEWNQKVNILK